MQDSIQLDQRLRFMQIDQDTRRVLAEIKPMIMGELPGILGQLYDHMGAFAEVSRLFESGGAMEMAKSAQLRHWDNILTGEFNGAYVDSVRRIGMTHYRIGLEPRWYIAGYAMILAELNSFISLQYSSRLGNGDTARRTAAIRALTRAAMLDMDFAISIFLEEGQSEGKRLREDLSFKFEQSVSHIVGGLDEAAQKMRTTVDSMKGVSEETNSRTNQVSEAANMASGNVETVAAAAEQLTSSIMEISRQLNLSSGRASDAVSKAEKANTQIRNLADAAEKISEVTVLIQDIAEQTNLLALNATIEAARAGDAGKGFAVVASEVKSLANQTAKATQDIAEHIQRVQMETEEAVGAIATISQAIGEINESTSSVSAAVEQQNAAASEIARSAQEAAQGTGMVTENISSVATAASQTDEASNQLVGAVNELAEQSQKLRSSVDHFLSEVNAA